MLYKIKKMIFIFNIIILSELLFFLPIKSFFDLNFAFAQNENITIVQQDFEKAQNENSKPKQKKEAEEWKEKKEEEKEEKKEEKEEGKGKDPCPKCPKCLNPEQVVLDGLKQRKEKLEKAEKKFLFEKKKLERIKQEINEKLEKLTALQVQIDSNFTLLKNEVKKRQVKEREEFEKKIGSLVKMYSGMKPKKAAKIIDKIDLETAKQIFLRMRESLSAKILSHVESEKAAKISEYIAHKKNQ